MNTKPQRILMGLALCGALWLPACGREKAGTEPVVARVGEAVITRAAFEAELDRRAKQGQALDSATSRETVIQEMIRLEVFYARALAAGYDRNPELALQIKRMIAARYEEDAWTDRAAGARPSAEDVEAFYLGSPERFTQPEKVRVAVLKLEAPFKAGEEQAAKRRAFAEEVRVQALDEAGGTPHFGLLAQRHSSDQATRYRGGDCGWLTRGQAKFNWAPEVLEFAFALSAVGEISPVVQAPDGFYLLKLMDRKAAQVAPLAEVRGQIEHELMAAEQRKAREHFEMAQKRGIEIEVNRALLGHIRPPALAARQDAKPLSMGHE